MELVCAWCKICVQSLIKRLTLFMQVVSYVIRAAYHVRSKYVFLSVPDNEANAPENVTLLMEERE